MPVVLVYVPDHYVMLQEMWCKDYSHVVTSEPWGYDDKLIEWRNDYVKRKAQKEEIKEKLMPIAWVRKETQKKCGSKPSDMPTQKIFLIRFSVYRCWLRV